MATNLLKKMIRLKDCWISNWRIEKGRVLLKKPKHARMSLIFKSERHSNMMFVHINWFK